MWWPDAEHLADDGRRHRQLAVRRALLADDDDALVLDQAPRLVEIADAELGPLQIGDQRERPADLVLDLAHDLRPRRVILVRAVREVEADRVDARVDERADRVMRRRDRPDRRDDLRSASFNHH